MSETKIQKAELLLDTRSTLGEGPVWDWKKQVLYWVDIEGKKLQCYNPSTTKYTEWTFNEVIGAAVPSEEGLMLLALERGLATFDFDTEHLNRISVLENEDSKMRFNDGKVGPNQQFYIGSMHKEFLPESGNLFRVDSESNATIEVSGTTISNGMAWTQDQKTFYFSDTDIYKIFRFDFDIESGALSNRKTAFEIPKSYGGADGMCIDSEDMLWIAHWGGGCIRRWDPESGVVMQKIEVDAPHVTSCCFGGSALDTLHITTARSGMTKEQLKKYPKSGGLFTYKTNVKGMHINYFKQT
ncbi:SMP-30/gluconolactonase/LRE family protein [Pseudozobellia sp. WGM2]|uniref:SMP-30/gluconolactonase/LRE family protein n=1 Tax=Pseudozobellia sp. WGM2 TaxID=2787625 RepID=UPI001ADFD7D6|nr:SMP-30/gluconolactonase/LRE family protein [Pseudozobellia sp. WGM2]